MEDSNSQINDITIEKTITSTSLNTIINLHEARSNSKKIKSYENSVNESKENINKKNHVFKAKPMPDFKLQEVKRSNNNLTIPNPPKLSNFQKSVLRRNNSKE